MFKRKGNQFHIWIDVELLQVVRENMSVSGTAVIQTNWHATQFEIECYLSRVRNWMPCEAILWFGKQPGLQALVAMFLTASHRILAFSRMQNDSVLFRTLKTNYWYAVVVCAFVLPNWLSKDTTDYDG